MRRAVIIIALVSVLALATGCAPTGTSDGGNDGLHSVVPDVTGMSLAEATVTLEEAGYVVGEVTGEVQGDPSALVVEQSPIAFTSLPFEGSVDLRVAPSP